MSTNGTSNAGEPPIEGATPSRPKTPAGQVVTSSRDGQLSSALRYPTRGTSADNFNLPRLETPRRVSATSIDKGAAGKGSGSENSGCSQSVGGGVENGDGFDGEGFRTPAPKGGTCSICLSPLVKSGGKEQVYTVQLCRHNFHRGCLTENRRAGNVGCPYCRGTLEQGLTPEATVAEKQALAVAARQQDQRQAIRNAAGRARLALARSLRRRQEEQGPRPQEDAARETIGSEESRDVPALLTI